MLRHYQGLENIGANLISADGLCLCLTADVDAHDDSADLDMNWQRVNLIVDTLKQYDLHPLICDSNGKGDYHVRQFFKKPVAANVVHWLGQVIKGRLKTAGLPDVEIFPKQGDVSIHTPYGSFVRLPGKHHKRTHYTRVWNGNAWLEGEAAVKALVNVAGDGARKLVGEFNAQQPKATPKGGQAPQRADDDNPDAAIRPHQGTLQRDPRQERPVASLDDVEGWCRPPGLRGVVLESDIIGNQKCVTREALARFIEAVTRAADGERPVQAIATRTRRQRDRDVKKACGELIADGA